VKALDEGDDGFLYLCNKSPNLTDAKIKEGIFVGPQIRNAMFDENFDRKIELH
jgi:hypothetical protein